MKKEPTPTDQLLQYIERALKQGDAPMLYSAAEFLLKRANESEEMERIQNMLYGK